ncbi:transmembrane protein [Heterostelium album PN500]|uniref:Transmembrane protein n=1 Tax=Heterostelium pallidum (strain ATCC 26659 / Pp 5 / PN500) TaxID=670386 RepID=D3BMB6_HETP5|nr:transmembrane protein [Heterostelium album PN500]EFA77717.1 transmembrane protein [Heterostelium album PN500]|eukprot:XP_020429845.1 transmembrane protein [Heterostelium album PN500]
MVFKDSKYTKGLKSSFLVYLLVLLFLSPIPVKSQSSPCKGPDSDPSLQKWSSRSTWGGNLPGNGDFVQIKTGMKVLLDIITPNLTQVWIQSGAQLVFSSANPVELITGGILIEGRMDIGDDRCRFNGSATITLIGSDNEGYSEAKYDMLKKYIGVLPGGRLELHGIMSYPIPSWLFLTKTIKPGDRLLNLNADASKWPVGSKIAIGATDFDYTQSEENEIMACANCSSNQILLKQPVQWYHYGEITYGIDERAEVGLLSKTIKIQGRMSDTCNGGSLCQFFNFDTLGGHIKVIQNFSSVHIQGVELYKMGQTYNLGYYPIHFHMCGDVDTGVYASWPTFVKDNSIHHTLSRCLTIHGTSGLIAVNNFAFDHIGHCYFFEDGSEQRNYLDSNVGLLTRTGYLLPSDRDCDLCLYLTPKDFNGNPTSCSECKATATFWVTNPNNVLRNNIAGGSAFVGFWYLFPPHPSGLSQPLYPYISPSYTTIGTFYNNKAHSNADTGMNVDQSHQVVQPSAANPNQYMSMTYARYKPRVNPLDQDSAIAPAYFYRFVSYKNKWRGLWARGGELFFIDCQFADNAISATLAQEGVMPADPGSSQNMIGSLFVAESGNLGMSYNGINMYKGRTIAAWQEFTQRGIELYDGPINCAWSTFINFNSDGVRNMSAIGWVLYDDCRGT